MNKPRKPRETFCTASVLALALLLGACGPDASEFTQAKLMQAIQTNPGKVELAKYVTTDWERVCVFRGPASAEGIQMRLGFAWPELLDIGIEKSNKHNLLMFIKGMDVHQAVMFEKERGDFIGNGPDYCVRRDSAVFRVINPEAVSNRVLAIAGAYLPAAQLSRRDTMEIMAAAAEYVRSVSGAYGVMIDPASANGHANDIARRLNVKIGSEREAVVCADPMNTQTCKFQNVDIVLRLPAPVLRDSMYMVAVEMTSPVRGEEWRREKKTYTIGVSKQYQTWAVQKGDPPPRVRPR